MPADQPLLQEAVAITLTLAQFNRPLDDYRLIARPLYNTLAKVKSDLKK